MGEDGNVSRRWVSRGTRSTGRGRAMGRGEGRMGRRGRGGGRRGGEGGGDTCNNPDISVATLRALFLAPAVGWEP